MIVPTQKDSLAAIVPERPAIMPALADTISSKNDPAPEARKSLAHPEASNAKPEGWVGYKVRSSPVGAAQKILPSCLTGNLLPSPKLRATTRQVSGHDFSRAVQAEKKRGFSPCSKPQGLKAIILRPFTARVNSCPDTCLVREGKLILINSRLRPAFLRASVSLWWVFSGVPA